MIHTKKDLTKGYHVCYTLVMDTSETYIKMRIAAIPDLGCGIKPLTPLHYFTPTVYVDSKGDFYYSNSNHELCQLERQDQLQEMVFGMRNWNDTPAGWALSFGRIVSPEIIYTQGISKVYEKDSPEAKKQRAELEERYAKAIANQNYWKSFTSMNQLWLAFVMKELLSKVWNGEKWIT